MTSDAERAAAGLGTVAIVGAGQVGTALGMALREAGTTDIGLLDRDEQVALESLRRGAGHRVHAGVADALAADVVVLALPIPEILRFLTEHGGRARNGSLVIDTGTTKGGVVAAMRAHLPPGVGAVGGHPLAGTETAGPAGADPALLRGAPFILCVAREVAGATERGRALATAIGSRPIEMDPEVHDHLAVRTIHLPHLVACALALTAGRVEADARDLVGGGFGSATRLAASDPAMVAGFLRSAPREVVQAAEELAEALRDLVGQLDEPGALEASFARAGKLREALTR